MIEKLPLGTHLKPWLESKQWFRRFKYSETGLWLWQQYATQQRRVLKNEAHFFRSLLEPLTTKASPLFDIGANTGWVSRVLLDYSRTVVAAEPDALNQEILHRRLGHFNNIHIVGKAVSSSAGSMEFFVHQSGSALNTFSPKWRQELESGYLENRYRFSSTPVSVPATTLDLLIAAFGLPAFVKVDVEGHEREVFQGLSQSVPLIVFEANLPVFLEETREIVNRLSAIDGRALFSFTHFFNYQMEDFSGPDELMKRLEAAGKKTVDIVCRMGNYGEYYEL
jgi:FkbM family methyltransferase